MAFPSLPDKYKYPSAYRADAFLDALREGGWAPGQLPGSVVYTYARFEYYLAAHPELYTPNHMLGLGPGRFYLVNDTDGRVAVNCLSVGAPAAVGQLEVQSALGVRRFVSIGTAGGFDPGQAAGDIVLVTSAVRDEGTSYHYLPAEAAAVPDAELTLRYSKALQVAGLTFTSGATVTTDAPFTTTAEEILLHRAHGVLAQEMEAAGLFAAGLARGAAVASAVVIDEVPSDDGTGYRTGRQRAGEVLRELLAATVTFLASA